MGKIQIALVAAVLMMQAQLFAAPSLKDGGVNAGSFTENRIMDPRAVWMSHPEQWMVFWGKIDPKSDYDGESKRYYAKVEFISPDNSLKMTDGPIAFENDGTAKIFKTTSFFVDAKTPEVPKPFVFGRWTSNIYVFDEKTGETTLSKTISFEVMESRPLSSSIPSPSAEAAPSSAVMTPETTYIEIETSDADKANQEEMKKLKAEIDELKKMLKPSKVSKKPKPKTTKKIAPKKT